MTKNKKIDIHSLTSLIEASHTIFDDYVTLITVVPQESIYSLNYTREFPYFDFDTEGSFVSYPKSKLKQYTQYPWFSVVTIKSCYSLN